jgi:cytoskeletal protein RodZ
MEPMQSDNKTKQIMATLAVLVVVVVIVFGAKSLSAKNTSANLASTTTPNTTTSGTASSTTSTTTTTPSTTNTTSTYKNGTYSSDGNFNTPGGFQSIGVSVTIQNDTVTNATVTDQTTDGDSSAYAQMFINSFRDYVVGKNVGSIHLYGVAGASLTSEGFNNALSQIKSQAHA